MFGDLAYNCIARQGLPSVLVFLNMTQLELPKNVINETIAG